MQQLDAVKRLVVREDRAAPFLAVLVAPPAGRKVEAALLVRDDGAVPQIEEHAAKGGVGAAATRGRPGGARRGGEGSGRQVEQVGESLRYEVADEGSGMNGLEVFGAGDRAVVVGCCVGVVVVVEDVGRRRQRRVETVRERDGDVEFQEAGLGRVELEGVGLDELD